MNKKPKPHQAEAISAALIYFKNHDRGKLIMPCGSGKTLTALWIADVVRARSIVICLPNLTIEAQAVETWLTEMHEVGAERSKVLVLGSDTSISKRFEVVSTTAQSEVDTFVKNHEKSDYVVFTTYHSAHLLFGKEFDFAIFDEAHRTVPSHTGIYQDVKKEGYFSSLLYDANVKIAKRFFMTATEKNVVGSGDDVVSMSDTDLYGEVFYQLTMKDAIEKSILSDYKILTLFTTSEEVINMMRLKGFVKYLEKDVDFNLVKTAICLLKSIELGNTQKALTFHTSVQKAESFAQIFKIISKELGKDCFIASVSSNDSKIVINQNIEGLRACNIGVLSNVQMLKEGFDLPEIDTVVFSDYKNSVIDIVQMVGRALRIKKDGRLGCVLIPCVIENKQDILVSGDLGRFQKIVNVLSLQDERIYYEFKQIYEKGKHQKMVEFKATNSQKIEALDINPKSLYENIELATFKSLSRLNFLSYEEAKNLLAEKYPHITTNLQYSEAHENILPPNMPAKPSKYYEGAGWISWYHFFDKDYKQRSNFWDYEKAKNWIQTNLLPLGINNKSKWEKYCRNNDSNLIKRPSEIPYLLDYYNEVNYDDLFEKKNVVSYNLLRRYLAIYFPEITTYDIYHQMVKSGKLNSRVPLYPDQYYDRRGEWNGWQMLFKKIQNNEFELFKKIVLEYIAPHYDYFTNPQLFYEKFIEQNNGKRIGGYLLPKKVKEFFGKYFKDFYDLFGLKEYRSYQETKSYYAQYNLKSGNQFIKFLKTHKTPYNVTRQPKEYFSKKGEWISWEDFLGL